MPGKGEGIAVLLLAHHSSTRLAIPMGQYVTSAATIVLRCAMAQSSPGDLPVSYACLFRLR